MLADRIKMDAAAAAKGGDVARRDTLRFLLAALHNREIEERGKGSGPLTDAEVVAVIEREVKKRREAIELFERGGRPEQAAKERGELSVLESYLPPRLPDSDVDRLIGEAIRRSGAASVKDMGKAMAAFRDLVEREAGGARVDVAAVSVKVKAKLGG